MTYLLFLSDGTSLQDEIGHYIISRDALASPELILDLWGRTLQTILYILPAQFGLNGARLASVGLSAMTVIVSMQVARTLGVDRIVFVPVLLLFQPWFAESSFMVVTEVPFSLIMILVVSLALKDRFLLASVAVGLLPLIRHEGIAMVGLWAAFMFLQKNRRAAALALVPYSAYTVGLELGGFASPLDLLIDPVPSNFYGGGGWMHFPLALLDASSVGLPVLLLAVVGVFAMRSRWRARLVIAWYFSYFALHVVLFRFGLFASGGYLIFLLPLAPFFAILAARGIDFVANSKTVASGFGSKHASTIPVAIASAVVIWGLVTTDPHRATAENRALEQAASWTRNQAIEPSRLVATHVFFYDYLPLRVKPDGLWVEWPEPADMAPGTVVIWDRRYSDRWGLEYDYMISRPKEWAVLAQFEDGNSVIFERTRE